MLCFNEEFTKHFKSDNILYQIIMQVKCACFIYIKYFESNNANKMHCAFWEPAESVFNGKFKALSSCQKL